VGIKIRIDMHKIPKAGGIYRPGKRSPDWLKIKSRPQQEFIVCGFTEGKGSRKHFGALIGQSFVARLRFRTTAAANRFFNWIRFQIDKVMRIEFRSPLYLRRGKPALNQAVGAAKGLI